MTGEGYQWIGGSGITASIPRTSVQSITLGPKQVEYLNAISGVFTIDNNVYWASEKLPFFQVRFFSLASFFLFYRNREEEMEESSNTSISR